MFPKMLVLEDTSTFPDARVRAGARVLAIGNFDGVHRGHQHIFALERRLASELRGLSMVLTFVPHPARVLAPRLAPPLITSLLRRRELLCEQGIEVLVEQPFDPDLAALPAAAFVEDILIGRLDVAHVCVGYDFTFGRNRAGTTEVLRDLLARRGRAVTVVPAFSVASPEPSAEEPALLCSSTRVRKEIMAGRVEWAARILGRPPEIEGTVVTGAGRGAKIGIPTANLRTDTDLVPAIGVYAATAELLGEVPAQAGYGRPVLGRYPAAVSVGRNPTFERDESLPAISIEAHLIARPGAEVGSLYGRPLRLLLRQRLRDELRFSSVEELVAQIHRDIEQTKELLASDPDGSR